MLTYKPFIFYAKKEKETKHKIKYKKDIGVSASYYANEPARCVLISNQPFRYVFNLDWVSLFHNANNRDFDFRILIAEPLLI